ncbi:hypothetical protein [Cupriavidus respiraculi]|uniref:hypothetical protein n=1 Tax=Cupriavidus respiraculi TaxID=195930 RepID=UPI001CC7DEBE|nr:hypothetical protein [Cupriavidus respiraculi]
MSMLIPLDKSGDALSMPDWPETAWLAADYPAKTVPHIPRESLLIQLIKQSTIRVLMQR